MAEMSAIVRTHRRVAVVAAPTVGRATTFPTIVIDALANALGRAELVRGRVEVADRRRAVLAAVPVSSAVTAPRAFLLHASALALTLHRTLVGAQRSGAVGTTPALIALAGTVHHIAGAMRACRLRRAVIGTRQNMAVL